MWRWEGFHPTQRGEEKEDEEEEERREGEENWVVRTWVGERGQCHLCPLG